MRILFYYPSNKRTVSIETLIGELIKHNHTVVLLTLCERGELHTELEKLGVKTFTHSISKTNTFLYHLRQILYLIKFCETNKIDTIFSHLQQANIVAVLAQRFLTSKVVIFRHHDYARNKKESVADRIINRLAQVIVVPSSGVRRLMLANEKINSKKLKIIPYIYNFNEYKAPDDLHVNKIKQQYNCELLLIMVSRLVPQKRHSLVFSIVNKLIQEGFDIKMLVMDTGTEEESLLSYINDNNLQKHIFLLGYKTDIIDFIGAADVLIHPSVSEASCSAVKEAGFLEKIVLACKDVGDFSDYILDGRNGFLMDVSHTEAQLYDLLKKVYLEKNLLSNLGGNLKATVVQRFSATQEVIEQYHQLL